MDWSTTETHQLVPLDAWNVFQESLAKLTVENILQRAHIANLEVRGVGCAYSDGGDPHRDCQSFAGHEGPHTWELQATVERLEGEKREWDRAIGKLDAFLRTEMERTEDFRAEIVKDAFTAPDADWNTILDSLRARMADTRSEMERLEGERDRLSEHLRSRHDCNFPGDDEPSVWAALPDTEGPEHTHDGEGWASPHMGKAFASHGSIASHTHLDGVRFERPDTEGKQDG